MRVSRAKTTEKDVPFERFHDRIARIAIPLEFFSVPVNVHVLLGDQPTFLDCGPRTPVARERIIDGLARLDRKLEDVGHVVLTHHHVDHLGLLPELIERGARAWAHEDELENCLDVPGNLARRLPWYKAIARTWGFSSELCENIGRDFLRFGELGGRVARESVGAIAGESTLIPIPGTKLRAIHVPGHSEGQIVVHHEEANVLFSADHVLERVTPNPTIYLPAYRGRTNGLRDYLDSLEALASLPRDILVCPGHGAPFTGLHARLDEIRAHHLERQEHVRGLLTDRDQTVLDLVEQIWPGIDRGNVVLASREVSLQLDLLLEGGRAASSNAADGDVVRWRRAA